VYCEGAVWISYQNHIGLERDKLLGEIVKALDLARRPTPLENDAFALDGRSTRDTVLPFVNIHVAPARVAAVEFK
jgi:hypothetical protein